HDISVKRDGRFAGVVGISHDGDTRHERRFLTEGFFVIRGYIALLIDPLIDKRWAALDHDELAAVRVRTRYDSPFRGLALPDIVDRARRVLPVNQLVD